MMPKPAPKPARKPAPQLSPAAMQKFAPTSDREVKKPAAKPAGNAAGLALRSPTGNPTMGNPYYHILHWVLISYSGFPAIFYFFTHGNPKNPFASSWCEKIFRDKIKSGDLSSLGFGQKSFDLHINGEIKRNSNGYAIKVFGIFLETPATEDQAKVVGQAVCTQINAQTNSKPLAIVHETPSPYHPENSRIQDLLGNEQGLGLFNDNFGNPCNIENCAQVYAAVIEAFFAMQSLCRTMAAIFGLGVEYVHPEYLSAEERNLISIANDDFFDFNIDQGAAPTNEAPPEAALAGDAMEEDGHEDTPDDGSANNNDDHSLPDDDAEAYAGQDDFIVEDRDGDEDPDGEYQEEEEEDEEEEENEEDDDDL